MKQKKALIAVNFIGFFHFLWDDIDMLNEMGYEVYAMGDNENKNRIEIHKRSCSVAAKLKSSYGNRIVDAKWQMHKLMYFVTGQIMLPIAGFLTCIFLGWVVPRQTVKDEFTNWGTLRSTLFALVCEAFPNGSVKANPTAKSNTGRWDYDTKAKHYNFKLGVGGLRRHRTRLLSYCPVF